jgi:hypothetical protein
MLATRIVVAAVAVIVALAALDVVGGESEPPERAPAAEEEQDRWSLAGPTVPPPGALAGTVYLVSLTGCRVLALDLADTAVRAQGLATGCDLWVAPQGDRAVVPLDRPGRRFGREIWLARLDGAPRLERRLGFALGPPAWSPDGREVAWCRRDGQTVVAAASGEERRSVPGCRPKLAPDGSVLTRPHLPLAPALLRDGDVLLDEEDLSSGFHRRARGVVDVLGYDQRRDGLLAVAVVRFSGSAPEVVVQLWAEGRLARVIELPPLGTPGHPGRFGEVVRFSPSGNEVAVAFPGAGTRLVVLEVETGELLLGPTSQHGFDWAPDGSTLALSTAQEVRILGAGLAEPIFALPIGAVAIAWR